MTASKLADVEKRFLQNPAFLARLGEVPDDKVTRAVMLGVLSSIEEGQFGRIAAAGGNSAEMAKINRYVEDEFWKIWKKCQ